MYNCSFLAEKSFFDHALGSVTVLQLQHTYESYAIKSEEMISEMKAKDNIDDIYFEE